MASGTLGTLRRQKAEQQRQLQKALAERERQAVLRSNRKAVIAEVCALFGWKALDPFAQEMVDQALAGEVVNIEQLKADIADWQTRQAEQPETEPETDTETENTENADISL